MILWNIEYALVNMYLNTRWHVLKQLFNIRISFKIGNK